MLNSKLLKYSRYYSTSKNQVKYTDTVLLPQTRLPLRLDKNRSVEREKSLPVCSELYLWQRENCEGSEFVLHDGPPYANGTPHMGHAVNKILKDTILRSKILQGRKVHYKPGWDCHGLPIELKAITSNSEKLTSLNTRKKARSFAENTINIQTVAFQSWGVIGDWNKPYLTFNNDYIRNEIDKFMELYEKGFVFRDVKPVYWSPSSRTALAEAELEYNSHHNSTAVILRLRIANFTLQTLQSDKNLYALIWTTTPWTLPCNQAICFNPTNSYSIVQTGENSEFFLIATNLIENISTLLNTELRIITTLTGEALQGLSYYHPFSQEVLPFLASDHVCDTKGTGLVHVAPAHGPDDFLIALKHNLAIPCLVDENGCYTSSIGSKLEGLFVLSEGLNSVLDMLNENILHKENYVHSYPYDWRTKQPVIIRASKQWFLDINKIKNRAMELLEDVKFFPKNYAEVYKSTLSTQILKRPYWCISRQRCWGVPIPVFYNTNSEVPITNRRIIQHLSKLLETHGPNYWWELPNSTLLPKEITSEFNISFDQIQKGQDIFDIWFDSGLSWSNALEGDQIADINVEGVDQFTGWFQSSLITSIALRDKIPYKSIYVHGFVVDEKGLKMSKSLGNVIEPLDILEGKNGMKAYGIDTLRWWVICHANSDSVTSVNTNVLQSSVDEVQKIRNVLRFAVGSLFDYEENTITNPSLLMIDRYMLHLLYNLHNQVFQIYNSYEYSKFTSLLLHFVTNPLSSLYYVTIKDRLYCDEQNSLNRKAAQFVLFQIIKIVTKCIAPIVPHLAEELYVHFPQKQEKSFFKVCLDVEESWHNPEISSLMENVILNVKKELHKIVGARTLNVNIKIELSPANCKKLEESGSDINKELVDILQVSQLEVIEDLHAKDDTFNIKISDSSLFTCNRCRRNFAEYENDLCNRCNIVCNNLRSKEVIRS